MNTQRLGDYLSGSDNVEAPYENLIMKILFSNKPEDKKNYIPCSPYQIPDSGQINMRNLGRHEKNLLGKMLDASLPVVCITGPMGSGKTTTVRFLYKYFLAKKTYHEAVKKSTGFDIRQRPATLLLAILDFKDFVKETGEEENKNKLIEYIINEMRARIKHLITDETEFTVFWDLLLASSKNSRILKL